MSLMDDLKALGVNVDEGLDRVMGDKDLYEMILDAFVTSVKDNHVELSEFDGGDLDDLAKRIHTLKGTTGNLSMTPLFDGYTQSLTHLRAGEAAEAKKCFEALLPVQEKILACIKANR